MKNHRQKISMIWLTAMLVFGLTVSGITQSTITYTYNSGKVEIETDSVIIKVTGGSNVPFYQLSVKGADSSEVQPEEQTTEESSGASFKIGQSEETDPEKEQKDEKGLTKYIIKFSSLSEFIDNNNNSEFDSNEEVKKSAINFPSQDWIFSNFTADKDSNDEIEKIHFSFKTPTGVSPGIELRNHINIAKSNEIKFDIVITDYTWTSEDSDAQLAIKIQVLGGSLKEGSGGNDLEFDKAYVNFVNTADGENGPVDVSVSLGNSNTFYFIYDNFGSSLDHDPTFGAVPGASSGEGGSSGLSLELFSIMGAFTVIGIIHRNRKN